MMGVYVGVRGDGNRGGMAVTRQSCDVRVASRAIDCRWVDGDDDEREKRGLKRVLKR